MSLGAKSAVELISTGNEMGVLNNKEQNPHVIFAFSVLITLMGKYDSIYKPHKSLNEKWNAVREFLIDQRKQNGNKLCKFKNYN